ncbi:hypothetical protein KO495_08015 [Colwellia sp. D2M02]|uniref:hypothetical protein n=1 Tax=Colwellia sp. D2M02 TaxID=2841562 RepID=UPI001C08DFDE|nr:hypothetical protein [Colwellia sp. D2M02]MBU2893272.1 hypothetical protein [Colwellia sp. D2M02]
MEIWQALLQRANYSFNHNLWAQAEEYYHQAIECLEEKWRDDIENVALLQAWVGAFHHLAILYEEQSKPRIAFRYLQIPHQRMTEISQHPAYSDEFQFIALRFLKSTLTPLLEFSKKHPACDSCLASLQKIAVEVAARQPILH